MKSIVLLLLACGLFAQAPEAKPPTEQEELSRALSEAGSSGPDLTRALERHLQKYPDSPQRIAIDKALAQWALEGNDSRRLILYGERVLKADPNGDLSLLDHLTRALLAAGDNESAKKALEYSRRYETQVEAMRAHEAEGHLSPGQWADQVDRNKVRAIVLEARALGNLGKTDEALKVARAAWDLVALSEAAREVAHWSEEAGRKPEAIEFYADSFVMEDGQTSEADRARIRAHIGELYKALNGSEKGLGDILLAAYDRTESLKSARLAKLRVNDPNFSATEIGEFTLPALEPTKPLALSSLKGKVVVMDFWATWCGPCKAQHPLIEDVKKVYQKDGDVVFLSIDADDDHSLVPQFVKEMHWEGPFYFDGGLERLLKISSIPTMLVLDRQGHLASRMAGYVPELFEDMLKQRIDAIRKN